MPIFVRMEPQSNYFFMFTGIIQEVGSIKKISDSGQNKLISIESTVVSNLKIGGSISVDGACLTIIAKNENGFDAEMIPETLQKTIAQNYQTGTKVNLEPAMQLSDRLDGHMVSGHIDFKAQVQSIEKEENGYVITINFPPEYQKYIAMKGSITINGVSLTVSKLHANAFEVSLIPHSLANTNLGELTKESEVNIEIDLLARYLENLLGAKDQQITYQFLQERGFI